MSLLPVRKRAKVLAFLAGGGLLLALCWALRGPREPVYAGLRLSQWLEVARTNEDAGAEAILRIGTNGLPFLMKTLQHESPTWRMDVAKSLRVLPRKLRPRGLGRWLYDVRGVGRADSALLGFAILGPAARPAAPELLRLTFDTNAPQTARRALEALGCLESGGLPEVLEIVRRPEHPLRLDGLRLLGNLLALDHGATSAVPVLAQCLDDPDPQVIILACEALAEPGLDGGPALAALRRDLGHHDPAVRAAATNTLATLAASGETLNGR